MPLLILALLLAVPLIEVGLFIEVGDAIGLWPTIALAVATAIVGIWVVRLQGFGTVMRARAQLAQGEVPARQLFDGFCLVIAGVMLVIPGFATDALAVLLLVPPVRGFLFARARLRTEVRGRFHGAQSHPDPHGARERPDIIEGEWQEVEESSKDLPPRRPAPEDEAPRSGSNSRSDRI